MTFRGNPQLRLNGNSPSLHNSHLDWMARALALAKRSEAEGEVPVGSLLVLNETVLGEGWNRSILNLDPTAHAEIQALRFAAQNAGNYRLLNTTLYVTLEPCIMCLGAMIQARISSLVFGAYNKKSGAVTSVFDFLDSAQLNHCIPWIGGVMESESSRILNNFFCSKRKNTCSSKYQNKKFRKP